jgi:hypothetical protein
VAKIFCFTARATSTRPPPCSNTESPLAVREVLDSAT